MNSHICHWSPSLRVAIDWRRKGIDKQPEAKKKMDTYPKSHSGHASMRRRRLWILRGAIQVRSETEKVV